MLCFTSFIIQKLKCCDIVNYHTTTTVFALQFLIWTIHVSMALVETSLWSLLNTTPLSVIQMVEAVDVIR